MPHRTSKTLSRKHLLGLEDVSAEEIQLILDSAVSFKEILSREVKKVPTLRGKTILNLFYEPSTRTRISFELAEKRLSADIVNFSKSTSSVKKGESLKDTVQNIEAMKIDIIVVRHSAAGAARFIAENTDASVINAGDGFHEHPTQALLDMFSIQEVKGGFDGLKVLIAGDIMHSRVARSNIWGLTKMGAEVSVCGPATLIPPDIENLGVKVHYNIEEAIKDIDVINILRIQLERQGRVFFPSLREYSRFFGINKERVNMMKKDTLIMHPGPINRGVELDSDVADGERSIILEQVTNGLAVRMAIMYLLASKGRKSDEQNIN
jgi:aspartate carbamoyltransferase catalytic subunit